MNEEVLFVLGSARSGTTLVNRLLREHFDYGMAAEGHWVSHLAPKLASFGDLGEDANIRRLVREVVRSEAMDIFREFYPKRLGWNVDITEDMLMARLPERSYAGVVYAGFAVIADQMRRTRVGNKDPGYIFHLPLLHSLFPTSAKYLSVMRDGRDVALSTMQMPWGPNSPYACAREWQAGCEAVEAFAPVVGPDRFLQIRYEDLLTEPDTTCRTLESFLGITLSDEDRERFVLGFTSSPKRSNFGKWRADMSASDLRKFEAVAGHWLDRYDYERGSPSPHVSSAEAAWYMGLEYLRRVRRVLIVRFFPRFKGD